jgi:hypothetical protein
MLGVGKGNDTINDTPTDLFQTFLQLELLRARLEIDCSEIGRVNFVQELEFLLRACTDQVPHQGCKPAAIRGVETFEHMTQTKEMSWMLFADPIERRSLIRFQDGLRQSNVKLMIQNRVKRVIQFNRFPRTERNHEGNTDIVTNWNQDRRVISPHHPEGRVHNETVDFILSQDRFGERRDPITRENTVVRVIVFVRLQFVANRWLSKAESQKPW